LILDYIVYPFVAITKQLPVFKIYKKEVESVLELPLIDFFNDNVIKIHEFNVATGEKVNAACFNIQENLIWGATAMIMNELLVMLKHS